MPTIATYQRYSQVHHVDRRRAEHMVKMLRKIERAEQGLPIRPQTYGQYVQLMCQALGVQKAAYLVGNGAGWHDENEYTIRDIRDIGGNIDGRIAEFLAQQRGTTAAA